MTQLIPSRELGQLLGNMLHREQTFGEIRGLSRLQLLINERKATLEERLNPKQQVTPSENV